MRCNTKLTAAMNSARPRMSGSYGSTRVTVEALDPRVLFASGDMDPTFNFGGVAGVSQGQNLLFVPVAPTPVGPLVGTNRSNAVAVEAGGKIISVGTTMTIDTATVAILGAPPAKHSHNFSINRYLLDGTFETSTATDFSPEALRLDPDPLAFDYEDVAFDVAVEPVTDNIIVLGTSFTLAGSFVSLSKYNFALSLLNATREDFGGTTGIAGVATAMAIQNDGSIIVVGSVGNIQTNTNMAMWKFSRDLVLDTTFGAGGLLTFPLESYSADQFIDVALSSDGSIYAVGVSDTRTFDQFNGHQKFIVTKVTTSGALDVGFDGDGIAEVADFGLQNAAATAVVVQADGRPVVAGYGAGVAQIARFTSTGALDTTFGTRGRFSVDGVKPAVNIDLKVQADGNLILTGDDVAGPAYFTARIRSEGSIDKDDFALSPPRIGYNFDGKSSSMALRATDLTGATAGRAIIQADGKIVVSGGFGSLYSPAIVFDPSSSPLAGTLSSSAKDVQVRFLSDALSPRPVLTALDHTTTNPYNIVVTITDDVLNDVASINANDFRIVYPTGTPVVPTLVSVSPGSNAKTVVVTLNVPPPGGAWNTADSNTNPYLVELVGAIQDTNGNAIRGNNGSTPASLSNPRSLGGFQVRINPPTIVPPAATLNAASVTNPAAQPTSTVGAVISQLYRFTVTYTDDVEVNGITIGNSDIIVTGPNFFSQVATVSPVGAFFPNSGSITVTYQIIAPRGTFDITDNGVYTVTLRPNQVSDTDLAPNYVTSGSLGQFSVNVSSTGGNGNGGETGGAPPVVSLVSILPLTTTDTSRLFTLVFDDDVGLNLTSINGNSAAIRVTGPRLYNELAVFVSMTNNVDGTVSALYTVPAPDGIFDPGDNGTYSISALPNQIADIDPTPNFLPAGTAGTFVVNVPYAVPTNGQLLVNGTDYDDTIHVTFDGFNYRVTANNILQVINGAAVTAGVNVMGHSGNDSIVLGTGINGGMVGGGPGNDSIYGSDGADNLSGGQGDDLIRGNDGNDVLLGRVGNDTVGGGKGDDYVGGGQDVDQLFGGDGDDTLFGGVAGDYFDGGAGNDLLRARDVTRDTILGGEGDDSVEADFGLDYGVDELIQV